MTPQSLTVRSPSYAPNEVTLCLAATTAFAQHPPILFQDDFSTSEPDGSPNHSIWGSGAVSGTTGNQWVRVTSENSESFFGEADNNYLHIYSAGLDTASHWIRTENQFAGSSIVSVHFDFQRSSSTGTNDPGMRIGQGNPIFNKDSTRFSIRFQNDALADQPVIQNDTTYNFQFIYNNTGLPVTYLEGQAILAPDSYDVWLDGERVLAGARHGFISTGLALDEAITSFGFGIWGANQAELRLDNLVIYDGAYAVGTPPPPPPVFEKARIFADDFSNPVDGATDTSLWKSAPVRLSPPNRILEITDNNSEIYFGEAENNYLRFSHDGTTTENFHLTGTDILEPTNKLITISFDFFEPSGFGTTHSPLEIIPGIKTVTRASQIHRLALANGSICGIANLYQEDVRNNLQVIFNNSHQPVTYLDGALSVASDSFDVWLNGRRVLHNHSHTRGTLPVGDDLASIQLIIWGSHEQEILLDNFEVFNYAYVKEGVIAPQFADDFSDPRGGKPNPSIWNRSVQNDLYPNRVIEVTDENSETYFGEPNNNYMRIFHDGTTNGNLNQIAYNVFSSNIITIDFDFFEPADFGADRLTLRPGIGTANNASRINEITIGDGNISGVGGLYAEGTKNRIQIVMNNSLDNIFYLGGEEDLPSDTYDVWINGELVLNNHQYRRGSLDTGTPLTSLQFVIWTDGSNEFLIDNLKIYDHALAYPSEIETMTFAEWAETHLPEGLRGEEDDASGDGISNLMKFFLGVNPLAPNRDNLPVVGITSDNGQDFLTLTTRLNTKADVEIVVEASTDLVEWTPLASGEPERVETLPDGIRRIRVTDTEAIDSPDRRFLRLKVSGK